MGNVSQNKDRKLIQTPWYIAGKITCRKCGSDLIKGYSCANCGNKIKWEKERENV